MRQLIISLLLIFTLPSRASLSQTTPPAAVTLEAKGSHRTILKSGEEDFYILVTLKAPKNSNAKKLPLNVAIVIDRSGSMADQNKLTHAKQAAKEFVNKLNAEDRLSLVEYDEQITVLAEPTIVGVDRNLLLKKIDLLEPRGSTDLAGGMVEGGKQVEKFFDENRINRVLLLSDGLANTGVVQIAEVASLAEGLSRKGIQVTNFGLGADFDEEMLTRIADASGGNYYFIETPAQIAGTFEAERRALSTVVAKKVRLTLEPSDQVEYEGIVGYSVKKSGGKRVVELPDLYSGQNRKILIRLKPKINPSTRPPQANSLRAEEAHELTVASIQVDLASVAHDLQKQQMTKTVTAVVTEDRSVFEKSANSDVVVESTKIASAWQMEEAMKNYSSGNITGANSLLNDAKGLLQKTYQSNPNPALLQQMKELDQTQSGIGSQPPDSEEGKLLIKGEKYKARQQQQGW